MAQERYHSRGVYYFEGRVKCPLAGAGERGEYFSNRLALDDARTEVVIDRAAQRILVHNSHDYPEKTTIADLAFLAEGIGATGEKKPFALHLKVIKTGRSFSVDLHRHLRSQMPMVDAHFEPFEVTAVDGAKTQVLFTRQQAMDIICRPSWTHRVVKALMSMHDNLDGVTQETWAPGFRVADFSLGFGAFGFRWPLVRVQLESIGQTHVASAAQATAAQLLREGEWELKLTAFSERWLPAVIRRDLFLFGLDQQPLLHEVRERGLRKGQTLSFRFEKGAGMLGLGDRTEPLPGALDVARAYLEFHMLGGLLAEQADSVRVE